MTTEPPAGNRVVGGRYDLVDELGRGGMGVVWLAHDRVLHREVALKEISYPLHVTDAERAVLRERTLREARAAAQLEHPHVAAIHDIVEEDGRPWLVMEHVRSRSLQRILEEDGPVAPAQAARIGLDVLSALEVAHAAGIVHRDVKPANVLITDDGDACLTDFGIATTTEDSTLTAQGAVLGSPSYMAPERAHGEPATPAVDLWSLGATLYAAVEGRTPFGGDEPMAILLAVIEEEPARPTAAGPLTPVLDGLLRKDPATRMSAAEVRRELTVVAGGQTTEDADPQHTAQQQAAQQPGSEAPAPITRRAIRALRGGDVVRIDFGELVALASSSRAALGTVVREVNERRHQPPMTRRERRAAAKQRRYRFKRRWVVVPMVLLVLLVVLVLGVVALLVTGAIQL
ncbi:serine/threonine-protein kinase [Modestobacter sp. NPDC049651]|uniref:serine/threonine-protein kinase n=1 Tax=unclassified Modestobacter TaxID=2643866 RepID=UPI0033D0CBAD